MKKRRDLLKVLLYSLLVLSCLFVVGCTKKENEEGRDIQIEENRKELENVADDSVEKNENMESGDKIEKPGEKLKEIRVYYVDEMTGEVTGKTVAIRTEEDIWAALQETGILTTDCQLLKFEMDENARTIDLDFNAATGNRIRSMGTTGEIQIIGCIINTYLEAYDCDGIKLTEEGEKLQTSHGANFDGYSGIMSF